MVMMMNHQGDTSSTARRYFFNGKAILLQQQRHTFSTARRYFFGMNYTLEDFL
jgi:hypothetical protein